MIHTYGVDKLAWERIINDSEKASESDAQYYAFMYYCSLSVSDNSRSYTTVARDLEYSHSTIKNWARQFTWETRATKFDDFMRRYTSGTLAVANIFDDETLEMTKTWITDRASFRDSIRQNLANNVVMTNALIKGVIKQTQKQLEEGETAVDAKTLTNLLGAVEKQDNLLRRLVNLPTNYQSGDAIDDADDDTVYYIGGDN